ncbi:uncharacterized protein FOMMEDRAFT_170153 [Fomitiporia mediterranea MF3/22]|uniref:uncharacterized protein n=1 Tax=Fomitiporia mediterranea (strain MF3/22) TaxID=694068 RepID=UPI0004409230|nr:uncharacterized protein FOMMEDRAFT_170153 [Fomitiporia mediterranea MF3/22]EJD00137.1 hypothetical protein FOMMEDRAFT_170153 [Fomitiporia mediterranea MF3/22]
MSSFNPAFQSFIDNSFIGAILGSMLYGSYVSLALCNLYFLFRRGSRILPIYTATLLCITTAYIGVTMNYAQKQLIDQPLTHDPISVWPQVLRDVLYSINTWLTDAYLLHRCFIVWNGHFQFPVLFFPMLVYLGSVATSITLLVFTAAPGATYSTRLVQVFGISNWSLSLALNVIVTILIAGRLLWHRSRVRSVLGHNHGQIYTDILVISIESAALYAVFELLVLATFVTNNPTESTFFAIEGIIQVIAPNLIIFRVARGKSFITECSAKQTVSNMVFSTFEARRTASVSSGSRTERSGHEKKQSNVFQNTDHAMEV